MVKRKPYRVLASFSYNFEEKPLRSQRITTKPPMTDTGSDQDSSDNNKTSLPGAFKDISPLDAHDEFIQMVINAKTVAQLESRSSDITWRGYTTSISPNFLLTKENLRSELLCALQNLITLSNMEHKVY